MDSSAFTLHGQYLMLALDHRGSFLKMMNPASPDSVTPAQAIELKRKITAAAVDQSSGLLIDTEYGLPAYSGNKPYLLPIEKSGYAEEQNERITQLEFGAAELKDKGAGGVKLLIYFNPEAKSAERQLATARTALEQAHSVSLPFFLEVVTYHPNGKDELKDRASLITRSVRRFIDKEVIPDVWKLEFPSDEAGCREVDQMVEQTPWILLTRGETFEVFKQQLTTATANGCRGFLAGRALWQEACRMSGEDLDRFLDTTLPDRFKQLANISTGR